MGMVADWITDLVGAIWDKAKDVVGGLAGKVLATFGLTTVTWTSVLPNLKAFVASYASGLSGDTLQMVGYLGWAEVVSMICSALTIRLAWKVFIIPKAVADTLGGG